jgi:hypothetical protein
MQTEAELLVQIRLALGQIPGLTIFRNNIGVAHDRNGRPVRFGLCNGSADLIGWKEERNGLHITAVFVAIEVKTLTGRITEQQLDFINAVHRAGGIAGVARSVQDALDLIA